MFLVKRAGILGIALLFASSTFASGRGEEKHCSDYLYGLYYGSWDNKGDDLAFVISSDGKSIPPKSNDPDAPTIPGFYAGEKRYEFSETKVSTKEIFFQTKEVDGTVFSFRGRFGCEPVDVIPEVPFFPANSQKRETAVSSGKSICISDTPSSFKGLPEECRTVFIRREMMAKSSSPSNLHPQTEE